MSSNAAAGHCAIFQTRDCGTGHDVAQDGGTVYHNDQCGSTQHAYGNRQGQGNQAGLPPGAPLLQVINGVESIHNACGRG